MTDGNSFESEFDDDEYEDVSEEEEEVEALAAAASDTFTDDPDIDSAPMDDSQPPALVGALMRDLPPMASILAGKVPLLMMAKSYRHAPLVPLALGVAGRVANGRLGLGAVVRLPKTSPAKAGSFLASCASAQIRIADPEVHTLPGTGVPTGQLNPGHRYQSRYSWSVGVPEPNAAPQKRQRWIRAVLDSQTAAGANVLLSASGWVPDQRAQASLAAAMGWVADSRAAVGGDPMFVNLTLASGWLSNPMLRSMLLDEIVESNEALWYLRVHWPIVEPRYGQLIDNAMLDGYKDLSQTARAEGKILVLANSGLTGWLATALGASGFSTGIGWPEQAFAAQRIFGNRPNQKRPPAVPRYFDQVVLHPLTWQASEAMANAKLPDYVRCSCRFCRQMRSSNSWEAGRAGAHYLVRVARLTSQIAVTNRRHEARRIVRAAQNFVASIATTPHVLTAPYSPGHLAAWSSLL